MRAFAAAFAFALAIAAPQTAIAQTVSEPVTVQQEKPLPVVTILFEPQSAVLPFPALAGLDALATAMTGGTARVEVHGYAGTPGDLSSDARRLSLRRCLSVRDYLVARGIARERVIVMPLGGAPEGAADRADIFHVKR